MWHASHPVRAVLGAVLVGGLVVAGATAQDVQEHTLPGGPHVWRFADDDADRFSIAVLVRVGSRDESDEHAGIAHFLEHVLFQSAGDRLRAARDGELLRRGITYNGYTSHEVTVYYLTGASTHWRYMVDWLADHVLRPAFDEIEVEDERRVVLQEIATTGPDFRALTFEKLLYGSHPIARSIGGSRGTLEAIDTADLRAFHERHYHAGNLCIGFAGRVSSEQCVDAVFERFAVPPGRTAERRAPTPRTGDLWIDRSGAGPIGALHLGYHVRCEQPEQLGRLLVLSDHLHARFAEVAREQRGLAYAPAVEFRCGHDAQRLEFQCDTRDRGDVAELADIAEQLVAEVRSGAAPGLEAAIARTRSRFVCTSPEQLAAAMELAAWVAARDGRVDDFAAELVTITPKQLAATAEQHLRPDARYSLSSVALLSRPSMLPGLLFLFVVTSGLLLYAFRDRVRAWRRRRPPQRGRVIAMPVRERISGDARVDVDEVEADIQRMFADEDRAKDDK